MGKRWSGREARCRTQLGQDLDRARRQGVFIGLTLQEGKCLWDEDEAFWAIAGHPELGFGCQRHFSQFLRQARYHLLTKASK
jgi:hypothetical protein